MNLGGLVRATPEMEAAIREIDRGFNDYHPNGRLSHQFKIRERTITYIKSLPACQDVDIRVITIFTKIKIGHRLKHLNLNSSSSVKTAKARDLSKTKHFSC